MKLLVLTLLLSLAVAQNPGVLIRGDAAMGFSHEKTIHHFRLLPDGGVIEAEATRPDDQASRDQIRAHMQHIASMFSRGDFDAPMFIHGKTPPGVPAMKRLRNQIIYTAELTSRGAQVHIHTADPPALAAVHKFLRFQIEDHKTHDPESVH